MRNGTNYFV